MSEAPAHLSKKLAVCLGTGLGVGFSPVMPGTVGALWGIPLTWAIFSLPGLGWHLAAIGVLAAVGIPVCGRAAEALGKDDPGAVVWDEFASVPMAFLMLKPSLVWNPWVLLAGFALHRLFDITKVFPANRCERLHHGLGIMADDWVAGAYACAALHLLVALGLF